MDILLIIHMTKNKLIGGKITIDNVYKKEFTIITTNKGKKQ